MYNALPRLIDVEHLDAAGRGLDPKRGEKFLPDFARASSTMRRGNSVVRRRERQFRVVNFQSPALEIKQPSRSPEIMEQMAIDMKKVSILAHTSDDMLVPDLGQQCATMLSQGSPPFLASQGRRHQRLTAALHGVWSRHQIDLIKARQTATTPHQIGKSA
jgi:hypothetical protein